MLYQLDTAGYHDGRFAYDVRTRNGAYAGIIIERKGWVQLGFDGRANRTSARKFASISAALDYMHARRERRGMNKAR